MKVLIPVIIGVIIVASIAGIFLSQEIGEPTGSFEYLLPASQFAFIGETEQNTPTDIQCKIKQTLKVYDGAGFIIEQKDSPLLEGSPIATFSLFTREDTGRGISHFTVEPKIWCSTPNSFSNLVIDPSQLTINVFVDDDTGNLVHTYQNSKDIQTTTFRSGSVEWTMTSFGIWEAQVSDELVDWKTFDSKVVFKTSGLINAHLEGCQSCQFIMPVGSEDIPITYSVTQYQDTFPEECPEGTQPSPTIPEQCDIIDTDRDGIGDLWDQCNGEKETYNGFEDEDGCPDTEPTTNDCTTDNSCPKDEDPKDGGSLECDPGFQVSIDGKSCVAIETDPDDSTTEDPTIENDVFFDVCNNFTISFKNTDPKSGFICDPDFTDKLQPLSFVNNLGGVDSSAILNDIDISPLLVFQTDEILSKMTVVDSNLQYKASILIDGQKVSLPPKTNIELPSTSSACIGTGADTECANTGLLLGKVVYSTASLENAIKNNPVYTGLPEDQFIESTVTIAIDGEFDVLSESGQRFTGVTAGSEFVWNTNFVKVSGTESQPSDDCEIDNDGDGFCAGEDSDDNDKCSELNVLEKLVCEDSPESDGGECGSASVLSTEEFSNGFWTQCSDGTHSCEFLLAGNKLTGSDADTCKILSLGEVNETDNDTGDDTDDGFTGGDPGDSKPGLAGLCKGNISDCINRILGELENVTEEQFGLGLIDSIVALIVIIIVIAIIRALIRRRRR